MNSCTFLVKIISMPVKRILPGDIYVVESQVKFGKLRKKKSLNEFQISIWGKLGDKFLEYYKIGDYIIIEGILTFKPSGTKNIYQKSPFFTVKKFYPFLLRREKK